MLLTFYQNVSLNHLLALWFSIVGHRTLDEKILFFGLGDSGKPLWFEVKTFFGLQ